jgi:ABC-type multidrug transport system permease subunit
MSLGLMLGSLVTDYKLVSAVTPVVLLPGILFSGFFKNTDNFSDWIGWTSYISPVKHGFSAFIQNEVLHIADSRIATLKLDMGLWPSIGALVALGIGFHLISLFFLWLLRDRPS